MRGFIFGSFFVAILLTGCAQNRLPKPSGLSLFVTHNYVISTKNSEGNPVEGIRFQLAKADLATVFTHDELSRSFETVSTNSNGIAEVSVSAQLAQHWKGGYYKSENEAEIERQAFPHGGRDIWGYFTEIRADGFVATRFSNGSNGRESFPVDVMVKTPASHGKSAEHRYNFQAMDISGKPVGGARVALSAADYSNTNGDLKKIKSAQSSFDCVTNPQGFCSVIVPVKSGAFYIRDFPESSEIKPFEWLYKSNLPGLHLGYFSGGTVVAAMPGFFESSSLKVERATYSGIEPDGIPLKVVVPQPSEFFCQALKTPESTNFAKNLDSWVRAIRISSWANKADLGEVCREEFKGRQHVTLRLAHGVKYNELKLNNYGIGVLVFDEVVRKMLKPLASASTAIPVDGLKVSVQTLKSNFIEKASPAELLSFDFYMPKILVAKYIDADISGQTLINGSIVLLNGERIDLELK